MACVPVARLRPAHMIMASLTSATWQKMMTMSAATLKDHPSTWLHLRGDWWSPPIVFLVCIALYGVNLDRMPLADELHHVLAGQSMMEHGEPRIAEGTYTRGLLYTWLVAQSFSIFGVSIAAARVPSVICMALLAAILFHWLRMQAGSRAAWLGAGLFAISPFAVEIAQMSRFYAPQSLALFVGAILTYGALRHPFRWPDMALRLGLPLPFLALGVYLQPTSLLGLAGITLWAAGVVLVPWLSDPAVSGRRKWLAIASLLLLSALALAGLWYTGILPKLWRLYREVPVFNEKTQNEIWYYHVWYMLLYPSLWTLTGIVSMAALAQHARPSWFLLTIFTVAFALTSLGGPKGIQYLAFAQPFLFALWGIGLASLTEPLLAYAGRLRRQLAGSMTALHAGRERLATIVFGLALLSLFAVNPFWLRTITLTAAIPMPTERPTPNWPAAKDALQPWLARVDVVVTTEELGTLFFLGRYDVRFSPSKLGEQAPGQRMEFSRDYRTGRPIIAANDSMKLILGCFASGVVLGPIVDWGKPHLINQSLARLIEAEAEVIALPAGSHLFAYGWRREHPSRDGPDCAAVRTAVHGRV